MRSVNGRRLGAMAFLTLAAVGVFWLGRFLSMKGIAWAGGFGSIASFFLAAFAIVVQLGTRWLRPASMSPKGVVQAGDALAAALHTQWEEEERLRRINDPRPMPVGWEITPTAEAAMRGVPPGEASESFAGQFDDILATFDRASRRLVILGSAGAGKSVLVVKLARELLADRQTRQTNMPVPVIFSASTWNTDTFLTTWIADQLTRNYPSLAERVKAATGKVTSLADALASDGVVPILDGLDELPEELRAKAIYQINARGSHRPLVLTSRSQEFLGAVGASGRAISGAKVVELRPLSVPRAKVYLGEATAAAPPERWREVFDRLDAEPDGALTAVLTTPLMLWLARTIYERSDSDPGELADRERFSDQEAIENHLLDAFVPAIYASGADRSRFRCTPRQAQRWLAFLAGYLDRTGSPDLAWWRLTRAVRGWRPIGIGIRAALSMAVAWTLAVGVLWRHGDWRHGTFAQGHSLRDLLLGGPLGRLTRPAVDQMLELLQNPLASVWSSYKSIIKLFSWGSLPLLEVQVGLIATALGILTLTQASVQPKAVTVRLRPVARAVIAGPVWVLAFSFLVVQVLLHDKATASEAENLVHMPSAKLVLLFLLLMILTEVPRSFSAPVDVTRSVSPAKALRLDRQASLLRRLLTEISTTTLIWLFCGPEIALAFGLWRSIVILGTFILGSTVSASELFTDARIWMTCGRRLPWRTMSFLIDAHRRGALRQVGAVYQFRHVRLQQRLSARYPQWSLPWPHSANLAHLGESFARAYDRAGIEHGWAIDEHGWQAKRTGLATWQHRDPRFGAKEAAATHREALRVDPEFAAAHQGLGDALYALDRYEDAAAAYREALRVNPEFAAAHQGLGDALIQLGRFEEGEAAYRAALRIDPGNAGTYNNLGWLQLNVRGNIRAAERLLSWAVRLDPTFTTAASGNLAAALVVKGDQSAARDAVAWAMAHQQPPTPKILLWRWLLARADGSPDTTTLPQVLAALDQASPPTGRSRFADMEVRAVALLGLGDDSATETLRSAASMRTPTNIFFRPMYDLLATPEPPQRLDQLLDVWREIIAVDPAAAGAWGSPDAQ
jgi:tetratricopeptide (TPR) repeat protein